MKIRLSFTLPLLLAAFLLGACGSAGDSQSAGNDSPAGLPAIPAEYAGKTNPLSSDASTIEAGKSAYESTCAACHGPEGKGDGPAATSLTPPPVNLVELQKTAGDDFLFWRISKGKEGTSMVAWETVLGEEQIWQVIAYLHTLK